MAKKAKMEDKVAVYISMIHYSTSISKLGDDQRTSELFDNSEFPSSLESLSFRLLVDEDNKKFFPNVTCDDFKKIVQKTKVECKNASMLLVVISSHGRELPRHTGGPILEYDHKIALYDDYINTKKIIKDFASCISPEKPKIFIIEACSTKFKDFKDEATQKKDKVRDFGITLTLTEGEPQQDFSEYQPPQETGHDESRGVVIPVCVQNSLVVFSSPSGYQSYTSPGADGGAWLLLEFRKQLEDETEEDFSLLEFLARVNQRMSYRKAETSNDFEGCKAVATIRHKLTEDITLRKQRKN